MSKGAAHLLIVPIFAVAVAAAGASSWVSQGPYGGFADAVAVDPATHDVYAGNFGGGVLKSTDLGLHWAPANTGLGSLSATTVVSVAASPSASGRLIIGTQNGIWLTTDGGASWSATNVVEPGDFEGPEIAAVAFAHSDPTRAYGAESGSHGVWSSVDSGAHWTSSVTGITDTSLISVAVDPTTADTVYAGTFGGRLFESSDGGKTWHESDNGIPHTGIFSLLVDPSQPATVIAGTRMGIYRSSDHGATWLPAPGPAGLGNTDETPYGLFAGTFGNIPTLYAAADLGGLFASTDHGASWHRLDQNLAPLAPQAFVLDTSANVAYAALGAGSGGAARSTDGGHTWSLANNGYTALYVPVVALDPRSPNMVLAGAWGFGVFRSTDAGTTWTATPPAAFVERLFFDGHNPAVAYFVAGNEVGVYKSTNRGQSWTAINNGLGSSSFNFQALAESGSGGILLTGNYGGGLFRSTDGGASWHPVTGFTATSIVYLAADPGAASTFFLATDVSIFKSTDGGLHWMHSATGYPSGAPGEILVDPFDSHVVLAASIVAFPALGEGAWRSANGGATWSAVGGPLANQHVRTYAADPAHAGVLYAGTFGGGVFRSADHGATWAPFTAEGLENLNVVALAVSSSGFSLQAGTDSTSTFRYDFPGKHAIPVSGTTTVPKVGPRP